MHESRIVAAMPPWTEPIGLYIHSAGSIANTARPSCTSTSSNASRRAIGGGGSLPSTIACMHSRPGNSIAAAADTAGSSQLNVRVRVPARSRSIALTRRSPLRLRSPSHVARPQAAARQATTR